MTYTPSTTSTSGGMSSSTAIAEGVGGVSVVVLAILGLAQVKPAFLVSIAIIVAGLAIFAQGSRIAGEYVQLLKARGEPSLVIGGSFSFSVELLAGVGGVILGVLALLQVVPHTLVAVAVITYGGALVVSSGAASNVMMWRLGSAGGNERLQQLFNETISAAAVVQSVIGLSAAVLGILSLAGFTSAALVLIALLVTGIYFVLSSSALGGLAAVALGA